MTFIRSLRSRFLFFISYFLFALICSSSPQHRGGFDITFREITFREIEPQFFFAEMSVVKKRPCQKLLRLFL